MWYFLVVQVKFNSFSQEIDENAFILGNFNGFGYYLKAPFIGEVGYFAMHVSVPVCRNLGRRVRLISS